MQEPKGEGLKTKMGHISPVQDPDDPQGADRIDIDIHPKAKAVRIVLRRGEAVLGFICIEADEAGELGQDLINAEAEVAGRSAPKTTFQ